MSKSQTELAAVSPAYRAYIALAWLPPDAPTFAVDGNGHPIVEKMELFCRARGLSHRLCGQRFAAISSFKRHMRRLHHLRPVERSITGSNPSEYVATHEFYNSLMKDVDYPGKRTEDKAPIGKDVVVPTPLRKEGQASSNETHRTQSETSPRHSLITRPSDSVEGENNARISAITIEDAGPNPHQARLLRPRRGFFSPEPDGSRADAMATTSTQVRRDGEADQDAVVEDADIRPSTARAAKKHKKQKRDKPMSMRPKVDTQPQDLIVIEDETTTETERAMVPFENVAGGENLDDMDDLEFEMEKAEIEQAQLQARLKVVKLKQRMALAKKRKASN